MVLQATAAGYETQDAIDAYTSWRGGDMAAVLRIINRFSRQFNRNFLAIPDVFQEFYTVRLGYLVILRLLQIGFNRLMHRVHHLFFLIGELFEHRCVRFAQIKSATAKIG